MSPASWSSRGGADSTGRFGRVVTRVARRVASLVGDRGANATRGAVGPDREAIVREAVRTVNPGLVVLHGPFRGLCYPHATAFGSSLFPKLLGSYERELHLAIEALCRGRFERVIDVGCAEGYYAVGLARRLPEAAAWAFDTDPAALACCREMASLNGVGDRLTPGAECGPDDLAALCRNRPCLVVSDCEGFERHLFTPDSVAALERCHVLVETHDFVHAGVSRTLRRLFEPTHEIGIVYSLEDGEKARLYDYEELRPLPEPERRILLAERRPEVMQWLVMNPRETA